MTETSSKGVLRSATVMFLFVGLLGIWTGGCEKLAQEQKVERLIKQLGHQKVKVRHHAAEILGNIRRRCNRCGACSYKSIAGSE